MTRDEQRALAFIAALLLLSAAVRVVALPDPVSVPDHALDVEAHTAATAAAVAEEARRSEPLAPGETLDPNTASAVELDRLPGVGRAVAERILADREEHGRYRTTGDLLRVPGVGPRTVERMAPHLRLRDGPPGPAPAAPGASRRVAGPPAGPAGGGGRTAKPGLPGRPDLNRASVEELQALPGIGPVLAERIVAFRDSAGPFPVLDSLLAVPGIGPATVRRIEAVLRAGGGR